MQDFQSIPGLAGRIFGVGNGGAGGGGAPDHRRLRGYPGGGGQEPPAKCPRCESTNTKFCYYNNYNLSQPRHFCKSCRRYWTKGGVLRNVPVGGGCRKSSSSKRSSSSSSSTSKKSSSKDRRRPPASSHSSSDSSSLTAASDPAIFVPNTTSPNPSLEPDPVATEPQALIPGSEIFSDPGSFTSLMTAGPGFLGLNFSDPPLVSAGMMDQSAAVDLAKMGGGGGGGGGGGINGLDWPAVMDPAFFDLTSAVDPGGYWNQGQWGDTDPNLYLP